MEALVAVGLAGNVVQFVQTAGQLISQTITIKQTGGPSSLPELRNLVQTLTKQVGMIKTRLGANSASRSEEDRHVFDATSECQNAGIEFLKYLDTLMHKSTSKTLLKSVCESVRFKWAHYKIEGFASKLDKLRSSLTLATILALRASIHDSHEEILVHLRALELAGQAQAPDNAESLKAIAQLDRMQEPILKCLNKIEAYRSELPQTWEKQILKWLYFRQISWRYDGVSLAYQKTFQWIFQGSTGSWDDFAKYLSRRDAIAPYFINGKAGSGKSTLMKFIVNDPKTNEALEQWAGSDELLMVNFFFWNLGTTLQKSYEGMLRSLIHTVLEKYPELIPAVFPNLYQNWKDSYAEHEPNYVEVKRAFQIMIEKSSTFLRLCIFIDGIDEFEGNHKDISQFLRSLTSEHVKLVISSRPINACLQAFRDCPSLRLQDLTMQDMEIFVKGNLCSHPALVKLTSRFPTETGELVNEIQTKASGVFLWVKIVVQLLVDGLEDGDIMRDLQNKLRSLPPDLRDLYRRMMAKMEPQHQTQAAEIFQLFHIWNSSIADQSLRTIVLYFSMQTQSDAFKLAVAPLQLETRRELCNNTEARIRSRCCGLLEVSHIPLEPKTGHISSYASIQENTDSVVNYIHRTVAEFLLSKERWDEICDMTRASGFDAVLNLCSGCLSMMKIVQSFNDKDLRQYLNNATTFLRNTPNLSNGKLDEYVSAIDQLISQHRSNPHDRSVVCLDVHWSVVLYRSWTKSGSLDYLEHTDLARFGSILSFAARTGLVQYLKAFGEFGRLEYLCRYSFILRALASWRDDPQLISLADRTATLVFLLRQCTGPESIGFRVSLWQHALTIGEQLFRAQKPEDCAELLKIFIVAACSPRALGRQKTGPAEICPIDLIERIRTHREPYIRKLGDQLEQLILSRVNDPSGVSGPLNSKALAFNAFEGAEGSSRMPTVSYNQSKHRPPPSHGRNYYPPNPQGRNIINSARSRSDHLTPISANAIKFRPTLLPLQDLPATNHFGVDAFDLSNLISTPSAPSIYPQPWIQSQPYKYHPHSHNMATGYRIDFNWLPPFTHHPVQGNVLSYHHPEGYGPWTIASPSGYPPYQPFPPPQQQPTPYGRKKLPTSSARYHSWERSLDETKLSGK